MSRSYPSSWIPMMREAGIAAESMFAGLTSLRKANYAQQSLYNHAFFGITIGLERMAKLAILLHSRTAAGGGIYPTASEFQQKYRHDLVKLFDRVTELRQIRHSAMKWSLPDAAVCDQAIQILGEFASSTRYYNLDVLVGDARTQQRRDPVDAWFTEVGGWILRERYKESRRKKDEEVARQLAGSLSIAVVMQVAEDGTPINTVYDAALRSQQMETLQREGVVICACLGRHIAELIRHLVNEAHANGAREVPFIEEFFVTLNHSESEFRRRKTFALT